jgi:predicted CopG family antitoxin
LRVGRVRARAYIYICICACMPSRNVAVQNAVYQALQREKRGQESFTSVIRRLLEHPRGLDDLVGSWGNRTRRADRDRLRALRSGGGRR